MTRTPSRTTRSRSHGPEFDAALGELEAAGLPLKAERSPAWRDFAGWPA